VSEADMIESFKLNTLSAIYMTALPGTPPP
jgi:hypothetical protein